MRNLKKILALVLALTMVLGLSISASAGTFTDVNEDDDYAAAIELLASLDVLAGMGDGTYNAAGSYTREQFTKILYVLVTGKDDGAAMYTEVAPFPDVAADRWSAGYINWAVQLGILVGRDDGLFHPTDVVNYAEACKMFLIAMGYSASMYTYPYGFIDKADSLKLFDDINGYATYAAANRGTVAQMAYNALFAEAPRFGTYVAKEGETSKTETKLLIMGAFGVTKGLGTLVGTSTDAYDSAVYADGQVDLMFEVYDEDAKIWVPHNDVFEYAEDVDDLIGMQVFVWSKEDENAFNDTKVYLIEDARKDKAYIVNPYDVIEIDDTTAGRVSFKDGEATRRIKIDANTRGIDWEGKPWGALDVKANWEADKDVLYRAIDTGNDGDFDAVYVIKPDFARITALSDDKVSLSAGHLVGSNDIMEDDDVVIALEDGLKKDDYVLVFPRRAVIGNSVDDAFAVIKAPVVEAVKLTKQSNEYDYYADVAYRYAYAENNVDLGKTYNLYLNANGFIAKAVEIEDEATGNYILVTGVYNNITNVNGADRKLFGASVVGYLADGTKKTLSVDIDEVEYIADGAGNTLFATKDYKDYALLDDVAEEGWQPIAENNYAIYCYGLNDDGVIDELEFVQNNNDTNDLDEVHATTIGTYEKVKYNETSTLLSDGSNLGFITSNTIVFNVWDGGKEVAVLNADDMVKFNSLDGNDNHTYGQAGIDGGNVRVVLINQQIKKTTDKYGLLISGVKNDVSETKVNYDVKVALDGEIVTLTTKNVSKNAKTLFVEADRYDAETNKDGFVNDDLKTGSGDDVIGYARIVLNASGKIDSLDMLWNNPDNNRADAEDGDAFVLDEYAVTAIPNSKGVAVRDTWLAHDKSGKGNCIVRGLQNSDDEQVLEYASDVAFYTIGMDPCGVTTNSKRINGATIDALMVSDLTKDVDNFINSDDTVYAIDVIMMQDDGENSDVAKAIFIYTTPVSGPEDEEHGNEFVPGKPEDEETIDPVTPKQDTYVDPATGEEKPVKFEKPIVTQPDPEKDEAVITLPVVTSETPANGTQITVPLADIFGGYDFYVYNETRRAVDELTEISPANLVLKWKGTGWTVVSPTPMPIYLAVPGAADSLDIVYTIAATNKEDAGLTVPTKLTAKNVTLSATEGKLESGSATLPTVTVNVKGVVANTDYTVTWYLGETKIEGTTTVNTAGEYKAVVEATEGSKVVSGKVELTFTVKGTGGEGVTPGAVETVKADASNPSAVKLYSYTPATPLTDEQVIAALAAAIEGATDFAKLNDTTYTYTDKDGKGAVANVPATGSNSVATPGKLVKVTYGSNVQYVISGKNAVIESEEGFLIKKDVEATTTAADYLTVTDGKATASAVADVEYVDAVKVTYTALTGWTVEYESAKNADWTVLNSGGIVDASIGVQVKESSATTVVAGKTALFKIAGELVEVPGTANVDKFAVSATPVDGVIDIAFATGAYTVTVDGEAQTNDATINPDSEYKGTKYFAAGDRFALDNTKIYINDVTAASATVNKKSQHVVDTADLKLYTAYAAAFAPAVCTAEVDGTSAAAYVAEGAKVTVTAAASNTVLKSATLTDFAVVAASKPTAAAPGKWTFTMPAAEVKTTDIVKDYALTTPASQTFAANTADTVLTVTVTGQGLAGKVPTFKWGNSDPAAFKAISIGTPAVTGSTILFDLTVVDALTPSESGTLTVTVGDLSVDIVVNAA